MIIKGIEKTFSSKASLEKWLDDKNFECGSPEAFSEWLENYFNNGNTISVHGELYDYLSCMEIL